MPLTLLNIIWGEHELITLYDDILAGINYIRFSFVLGYVFRVGRCRFLVTGRLGYAIFAVYQRLTLYMIFINFLKVKKERNLLIESLNLNRTWLQWSSTHHRLQMICCTENMIKSIIKAIWNQNGVWTKKKVLLISFVGIYQFKFTKLYLYYITDLMVTFKWICGTRH